MSMQWTSSVPTSVSEAVICTGVSRGPLAPRGGTTVAIGGRRMKSPADRSVS
ncbi:hypothetical protein D3C87_1930540 [compost metagenome]